MKVLFAHDHIFVRWDGRLYSPGRLPYAAFGRYLEHFAKVFVVARVRDARSEAEVSSLQRSDGPGVEFVLQQHTGILRSIRERPRFARDCIAPILRECDGVIVRLPSRLGSFVARKARRLGKPVAAELVQSAFHALWYHGSLLSKVYAPILDWSTRHVTARANCALYVTSRYLQGRYPCPNVTAAASNVELAEVPTEALTRRLARLKTERDEYAFGFVGTLDSNHKGLDTALLALSKLPAAIKWRFEVVGEGGQMRWRQLAESLGIADRVRFLGVLPGSKAVRSWLQGIDIYLQPSHTEGLPRSLIEAMSEGCLGIGSSVSGIPELLTAQFLHPPGDADALLAVIRRVLSTPDIFEQAAERNFEISREYLAPRLAEIRREFFANFARVAASARSN